MTEGAAAANVTTFISTRLKEITKLFRQFFGQLFAIIGFASMNTSMEKPLLMMALVFMVTLYYLVLVLVEMLQFQIQSLVPFMMVILLLGSVVSFLALIIISPIIAWIHLGLWIFIFALMCYKYRKELYQMIPKRIKKIFECQRGRDYFGMPTRNVEIPGIELLPV
ncbi:hypothetical protein QL285_036008 [Trifolium repens]|nr:hypothetical protein QL285_036008 [Trifolium repens]